MGGVDHDCVAVNACRFHDRVAHLVSSPIRNPLCIDLYDKRGFAAIIERHAVDGERVEDGLGMPRLIIARHVHAQGRRDIRTGKARLEISRKERNGSYENDSCCQ